MLMCGVGAKPVAHLMKWVHLLQREVAKIKFSMNSNTTLTVLNLHQKTDPKVNSNTTLTVLNLHQKTDPKVQQDFKGQGHYGKVKGQIKFTP